MSITVFFSADTIQQVRVACSVSPTHSILDPYAYTYMRSHRGVFLTLRSVLSHITSPKAVEAQQAHIHEAREREREHSSRLSALSNFSLGDMFDSIRDGSKSVKFPEKLLKVLDQRLEKIGMNQDPGYVLSLGLLSPLAHDWSNGFIGTRTNWSEGL